MSKRKLHYKCNHCGRELTAAQVKGHAKAHERDLAKLKRELKRAQKTAVAAHRAWARGKGTHERYRAAAEREHNLQRKIAGK